MNALFRGLSLWALGTAVYLGGWYADGVPSQAVQMASVALFIGAGFLALVAGDTRRIGLSSAEYVLGGAFVFAMLVAFARESPMSTAFGAMFLMVLASAAVLARQPWVASLDRVFRCVYIALVASVLVTQPGDYLTSVAGTVERSVGLVRFTPLGMHPNLAGLVYGGGSMLFVQHFLSTRRTHQKLFALLMAGLCLSMVLAASARASLLALGVTGVIAVALIAWRGSRRARTALGAAAIGLAAVALAQAGTIARYLGTILDLDSPTRGTASGATGREDLWREGIELVFSDPVLFFTGRGVRAAGPEVIGFPVESSYINLALEHGVLLGFLIVLVFAVTAWRALGRSFHTGAMNPALFLSGSMLLFILVQSIFNRYLIAVGNPFSLLVLLVLLRLGLGTARLRSPAFAPAPVFHAPRPPAAALGHPTGSPP